MKTQIEQKRENMKKQSVVDKIARFLYRMSLDGGEMVGMYEEQGPFWKNEARKIIRIIQNSDDAFLQILK